MIWLDKGFKFRCKFWKLLTQTQDCCFGQHKASEGETWRQGNIFSPMLSPTQQEKLWSGEKEARKSKNHPIAIKSSTWDLKGLDSLSKWLGDCSSFSSPAPSSVKHLLTNGLPIPTWTYVPTKELMVEGDYLLNLWSSGRVECLDGQIVEITH